MELPFNPPTWKKKSDKCISQNVFPFLKNTNWSRETCTVFPLPTLRLLTMEVSESVGAAHAPSLWARESPNINGATGGESGVGDLGVVRKWTLEEACLLVAHERHQCVVRKQYMQLSHILEHGTHTGTHRTAGYISEYIKKKKIRVLAVTTLSGLFKCWSGDMNRARVC